MVLELAAQVAERLARTRIRDVGHLQEIAARQPGKVIAGFGELPRVVPFTLPETTFMVKPDAPDPNQIQEVIRHQETFQSHKYGKADIDPLMIAVLIHRMMQDKRTSHNFENPGQAADQMAGYSIHRLIQACEEILPVLPQAVAQIVPKKLERLETRAKDSREEVEKMDLRNKLEEVSSQWWSMWHDRSNNRKSRAEGFFKYHAVGIIGETIKNLSADFNQIGYAVYKNKLSEWEHKGILSSDKKLAKVVTAEIVGQTGLSVKTAKLITPQVLATIKSHRQDLDQCWTQICNLAEELFLKGEMPGEVLVELIRNQSQGDYHEVESLPEDWEADFNEYVVWNSKDWENYPEDFWNYLVGSGRTKLTLAQIKQVDEYYQHHHLPYDNEHHLLNFSGCYEVDPKADTPKSYLVVSPILPKSETLAQASQRTGETSKIKGFSQEKNLVEKMLSRVGVEADAWGKWVEATKRLGLSSAAKRKRLSVLNLAVGVRKDGVKVHENYGARYWNYNIGDELRFASQEEMEAWIGSGVERYHQYREHGHSVIEEWATTVVAARCDAEYELDKYSLSPKNWRQMYKNLYGLLKEHNKDDISIGLMAANLRGSMIAGLGVAYDQWHINGLDIISEELYDLDEFDLIMMLPDMAVENGNSPWYLALGYKLLLQMDTDLREKYAPQIQASFDELINQSVLLNRMMINPNQPLSGFPEPDIWVNMTPNYNRVNGWVETAIRMYQAEPEIPLKLRSFDWIENVPWTDPDLKLNRETGLITKRETAIIEAVLPGMETARARLPQEISLAVEALAKKPESAGLEALTTAADLIRVLVGSEKLDPEIFNNPARMIALLDQVIQVSAGLRGASREEIKAATNRLEKPLSAEKLSLPGWIMETFMLGGFMEKEAVIEYVLRGLSSGFLLSMKQGMLKIEQMAKDQHGEAAEWGFMADRDKLTDLVAATHDRKSYLELRRKYLRSSATAMAQIGEMISYEFSANTWLQMVDQLTNLDDAARLRCYCVQQSYLLYDVIKELTFPLENRAWASLPEVSLAIIDDEYGLSFDEFQAKVVKGLFVPDKSEAFSHYHVLIKLPVLNQGDLGWYLMLDQTTQRARLFDQSAVETDSNGNLIVQLKKSYTVSDDGREKLSAEKGKFKVVVVPNVMGESIDPVASDFWRGFNKVGAAYSSVLGVYHPINQLKIVLDETTKMEEKVRLLTKILTETPFFLYYDFTRNRSETNKGLIELISICNANRMPAGSLYLARLIEFRSLFEGKDDQLAAEALTQCSVLTDTEWENSKTTWQHLFLPDDLKKIEARREELKAESEAKKQKMMNESVVAAGKILADQAEKTKAKAKSETASWLKNMLPFGDISGSELRIMSIQHNIEKHANNVDQRLQEREQSPMLGAGEIIDDNGLSRQIASVVAVKSETAAMAAEFLLPDNKERGAIDNELRLIRGTLRAFVLDGRGRDLPFMTQFLNTVNNILSARLSALGIKISLPAGDIDSLRGLSNVQVLAELARRFGKELKGDLLLGNAQKP